MQNLRKKYHFWRFYFTTRNLRKNFPFYKIKSIEETIEDAIVNRKSISRFGDGEFRLLLENSNIGFQSGSSEMTARLREVIHSKLENHMVALPETFSVKNNLNWRVKYWWLNFINNIGVQVVPFLNSDKTYGNAFITRFYLDYEKKEKIPRIIKNLKKIWDNQNILIVEGKYSRLGVGNDLFENSKSIKRILCPEKNAFYSYESILQEAKKHGGDKLILIALGPTATIMAYDLAKENFWALDIGHIDLEYMWYLKGEREKTPVEGRLVNETEKQLSLEIPQEFRKNYEDSILAEIKC
ncbi:DUF1792 domain-containing protein [Kaistella sp. G5-32]|uniref:DUF1792 domain-containing protein n=1 Tax=Kaistella gelatinilytica TaxID=2787636 RepID=A0ABS0FDK4_9FLAO|nr:GT-D fold domain-containing glycosyltransferase [Kaistella gelatinilytica]MBF8457727.1 DUF1792 domain-containing protein [Kaistella gelatinilytica]